jgi:hypothetical protein
MKIHALRSISKIKGSRAAEALSNVAASHAGYLRAEAERLMKKG